MVSNHFSIILVEDDETDTELIIRSFQQHPLIATLLHVRDGIEAFRLLRCDGTYPRIVPPWIILLDIHMPRMNGIEFLRELRQDPKLANSIVFVLTISANPQDRLDAYAHHVAGYIVKSNVERDFVNTFHFLENYRMLVAVPDAPFKANC